MRRNRIAILVTFLMISASSSAARDPEAVLSEMLNDPRKVQAALVALQTTRDADLKVLLVALTRSADPGRRRFAIAALSRLAEEAEEIKAEVAAVLKQRFAGDPDTAVRLEAMARLLAMEALDGLEIRDALGASDERVRCLAADALLRRGEGAFALEALDRMASSSDLATACSARLNLLSLGYREHLAALEQTVRDRRAPERIITQILAQISEERIASAAPLAQHVAESDRPLEMRIHAYSALAEVLPTAPAMMHQAIRDSGQIVFQVNLLGVLAARVEASRQLRDLAAGEDAVGLLARFELARRAGGSEAASAAKRAVALGHPVVIGYILDRAGEDTRVRGMLAGFYAGALLDVIHFAKPSALRMEAEHYHAARAATILADLGTAEALGGLRRILSGRYGPTVRAVAAGLVHSKNAATCELARPLLNSPYEELSSDAAMILGRFGERAATRRLEEFATSGRHPTPLVAMSCWYLLKIHGRSKTAAQNLADNVK